MNYKVGDEVMCIDAQTIYRPTRLVAGKMYTVTFLAERCVALDGVLPLEEQGTTSCCVCGTSADRLAHFLPSRFIKLDRLTESSTEQLTEKV